MQIIWSAIVDLITSAEVDEVLKELKHRKSPGIDAVNLKLFECASLRNISKAFRYSKSLLETCQIPNDREIAVIKPIFRTRRQNKLQQLQKSLSQEDWCRYVNWTFRHECGNF
jgi:hypothetical protein